MPIDVHAHFWTDAYLDKVAALGHNDTAGQRGMGAGDGAELDARLALMDRAGVAMQVLSASPQLPHGLDQAAAIDAARYVNDQYADLVARHPGRFAAFASLPLPHLDASFAELGRALDDLGMVGVAMTTTILDQALVDSPAAQLFAELHRRGTVLYLHPAGNAACTPLIANYHGTWGVGAPVEDTISALRCPCSCSGWTTRSPGRHPKPPKSRRWPPAGCGTTPSATATRRRCAAPPTPSAPTASSSAPTTHIKTEPLTNAPSVTSQPAASPPTTPTG